MPNIVKKKSVKKTAPKKAVEPQYTMSHEVKDWIENAVSRMSHQASLIEAFKIEVAELKAYKKWAAKKLTTVEDRD